MVIILLAMFLMPKTKSNAQNLGIGIASPTEKLDLNGAIKIGDAINTSPGDGTLRYTSGNGFEGRRSGAWVPLGSGSLWTQSGSDVYYVSGNVGIGTSVIPRELQIEGNNNVMSARIITTDNTGVSQWSADAGNGNYQINIYGENATGAVFSGGPNKSGLMQIRQGIASGNAGILINTAASAPLYFGTGNALRMIVEGSSGNIGIATTTPSAMLTIAPINYSANQDGGIELRTTGSQWKWGIKARSNSGGSPYLAIEGPADASGNTFNMMTFGIGVNSGNIGIGTTDPQGQLTFGKTVSTLESNLPYITHASINSPGSTNDLQIATHSTSGSVYIATGNGTPTNRMVVRENGRVGIGTMNPTQKFVVEGIQGQLVRFRSPNNTLQIAVDDASGTFSGSANTVTLNSTRLGTGAVPVLRLAGQGGIELASDANNVRVVVNNNGRVGIGTAAPTHLLHVNGVARSTSANWATSSDARVKQNIRTIDNAIEIIEKLRPVTFEWKEEYKAQYPALREFNYGFISQEVEQLLPSMVTQVQETVGETTIDDFRVLSNDAFVPLLVEAVKDLSRISQELQAENETLKSDNDMLRADLQLIKEQLGIDLSSSTK